MRHGIKPQKDEHSEMYRAVRTSRLLSIPHRRFSSQKTEDEDKVVPNTERMWKEMTQRNQPI